MTKEKQVTIKMDIQSALEVLQVLDSSTYGYSNEFPPERIVRLRKVMDYLSDELQKSLM